MSNIDWILTRNDIYERALNQIGALAEGAAINDQQYRKCNQNLNICTQELQRINLFIWNTVPYALTTAPNVAGYQVPGNDLVGVNIATYTDPNGNRMVLPVRPYSDYLTFAGPQLTRGIASNTSVHIDNSYAAPTIYIYPTPDAAYVLNLQLVKKLKDWDTAAGNDFPPWWVGTLIAMLAAKLAPEFGIPLQERTRLDAMAEEAVERSRIDCFKNTNYDFSADSETYERN